MKPAPVKSAGYQVPAIRPQFVSKGNHFRSQEGSAGRTTDEAANDGGLVQLAAQVGHDDLASR